MSVAVNKFDLKFSYLRREKQYTFNTIDMKKLITIIACTMFTTVMNAQKIIPLYEGAIPSAKPCDVKQKEVIDTTWNKNGILIVSGITVPTLTVYRAEKPNGTCVLICPGGGYGIV